MNDHYNAAHDRAFVQMDLDGDGVADFQIALTGDLTGSLSSNSFIT